MNTPLRLAERIAGWTGIDCARGGRITTLGRVLAARVAALGLPSLAEYADLIARPDHPEAVALVNALTVNHSWFFRDAEQLRGVVDLLAGVPRGRPAQVWVAGCATGEDVYTLAFLLRAADRPAVIIGSDLNAEVIDHAARGRYGEWSVAQVPPDVAARFARAGDGRFEVPAELRPSVRFTPHNLVHPPLAPPDGGGWDAIVCRNVLIYFDRGHADATLARLGAALAPGGWLHLGAGEVIHAPPPGLTLVAVGRRFALRRPAAGPAPAVPPPAPRVAAPRPVPVPVPTAASASGAVPLRAPPAAPAPALPPAPAAPALADLLAAAGARFRAGDFAAAIERYSEALAQDPLSTEAHLFVGIAAQLSGDPLTAARVLRGVLFLDPDLWLAAFYLAQSYEVLGRLPDARREYRRAADMATRPLKLQATAALADLDAWRSEIAALARHRGGARP
ncbi:MAG TPA: CheR family methyltransferase [Polyangia bacterium]